MCGRMANTLPPDAMARLFEAAPDNDLPPAPRFNICPTQSVAVVTHEAAGRRYRTMRWGFVPEWYKSPTDGPLLINARAETIAEKPAFRAACREPALPRAGLGLLRMVQGRRRQPFAVVCAAGGWRAAGAGRDLAGLGGGR